MESRLHVLQGRAEETERIQQTEEAGSRNEPDERTPVANHADNELHRLRGRMPAPISTRGQTSNKLCDSKFDKE